MRWAIAACSAWFVRRQRPLQRLVIAIAAAIFVVQWVRAAAKLDDGDFFLHWKFASRFVQGRLLYADGLHVPYPPFWAMAWSPIAAFSLATAKALAYPLSLTALAGLLFLLDRLVRPHLPLDRTERFWATALALGLVARFLIRELPECGPNLLILTLTWSAIYLWTRRRDLLAGGCLGLAAAMKCTPALFVLYFAWKRQWKMAASSVLAAGLFTLAPAVWQGPASYRQHAEIWLTQLRISASQNDPSRGILGEEELKNLSLRPAAARFLMRLPERHLSRIDHPAYFEFLDLAPADADRIVKLLTLALLAGVCWAFRGTVQRRDDLSILWECAGISTLMLLLSPITWAQHCVALLPAFYLLARTAVARGSLPGWVNVTVVVYAVINVLLNRGLIGKDGAMLLACYHLPTFSFLGILAAIIACRQLELARETGAGRNFICLPEREPSRHSEAA